MRRSISGAAARRAVVAALLVGIAALGGTQDAQEQLDPLRTYARSELRLDSLVSLKPILIVDNGRTMPMDSYARNLLLRLSGRRSYQGMEPIEWLARVLFTPGEVREDTVFLIENPEVLVALGLDASEGRDRYSLAFVLDGIEELERLAAQAGPISEDARTLVDRELLRLWNNVGVFVNVTRTMAFTYPDPAFAVDQAGAAARLGLPGANTYSYLDIALKQAVVREAASAATSAHTGSGEFSPADQTMVRLAQNLALWRETWSGLPLPVLPVASFGEVTWLSPWQALDARNLSGQAGEHVAAIEAELLTLRDMQIAYLEGRQLRFDLAARSLAESVRTRMAGQADLPDPRLEVAYNTIDPLARAQLIFLLGAFALMAWLVAPARDRRPLTAESSGSGGNGGGAQVALPPLTNGQHANGWRPTLRRRLGLEGGARPLFARIALWALLIGFVPLTAGILMRMAVSGRPPVTNLFETFVFVAWAAALGGLIYARLYRNLIGPAVGIGGGLLMLALSGKFGADGDTLPVLQAVLDTNFWLSTHVTTITLGYAACVVAGIVGRIYMVQLARWPERERDFEGVYRNLFAALAFGLTLSFIGTLLGGVWADQSWGRFWGWDPKENGALLIVLWSALLFHAKLAKLIGKFGMAAGSALLTIVVMFAWFGINLLGVGLHSYGFIDGVLTGLVAYTFAEVAFVTVVGRIYRSRRRASLASRTSTAPSAPPTEVEPAAEPEAVGAGGGRDRGLPV